MVSGSGFRVRVSWFRVPGSGFGFHGFGFRFSEGGDLALDGADDFPAVLGPGFGCGVWG
jgi:hypothetical protein